MESLALMASIVFMIVVLSGPVSLAFLYFHMPVCATIAGLIALTAGLKWFNSLTTSARYLGLLAMLMGGFAVGYAYGQR